MQQGGAIMMNPDSQEVCYVSQSSQDENSVIGADSLDNISKMMKPNRLTNQQYEPMSRGANLQEAFFRKEMNQTAMDVISPNINEGSVDSLDGANFRIL